MFFQPFDSFELLSALVADIPGIGMFRDGMSLQMFPSFELFSTLVTSMSLIGMLT